MRRPNRATSRSPSSRITTMKPLTAIRPSAPVVGSTWATSVTCSEDQSTAVPSDSPKASAMTPSSQAIRGILVRTPSTEWSTTSASGVIRSSTTSTATATTARMIISGVTIAPPVMSSSGGQQQHRARAEEVADREEGVEEAHDRLCGGRPRPGRRARSWPRPWRRCRSPISMRADDRDAGTTGAKAEHDSARRSGSAARRG